MVLFEPGEVVPPGQPIVGLSGAQKIEVAIGIPERLLASVETGQPAALTLPLFDNRKITGTLTAVSHAAGGPGLGAAFKGAALAVALAAFSQVPLGKQDVSIPANDPSRVPVTNFVKVLD